MSILETATDIVVDTRWRLAGMCMAVVLLTAPGVKAQQPIEGTWQPPPLPQGDAPNFQRAIPTGRRRDGSDRGALLRSEGAAEATLIPPYAESAPTPTDAGGYCYVGAHPVDTRVVPGAAWDPTPGQHVRPYAAIDTRLFAFRDGCYYFTGDPRDFGYAGQTYSYYGAHPLLASAGGGWCFMMGGHAHVWAPWSPYFTVVGPWNYWQGAYDPFFWAYWPYYSHYYRAYYPHYYGGGRFYRGGGYRVAPPIRNVPASAWRGGGNTGRMGPTVRGMPPTQMYRPSPMGERGPRNGFGGPGPSVAPGQSGGNRPSFAPRPGSSFSPSPRPSFSPGPGSMGPRGGGSLGGGGNFRGGGSFHGGGRR